MEVISTVVAGKKPVSALAKEDLLDFLAELREVFAKEPQVMRIADRAVLAGDTHSDHDATRKVLNYLGRRQVIFLGDYVDRAPTPEDDLRNILLLFHKKRQRPELVLLRGNHEDRPTNSVYGFRDSVLSYWDEEIYGAFNEVFGQMPLVAANARVIALHGGLPDVKNVSAIKRVPKGLHVGDDPTLGQILWNDHIKSDERIIREHNRGVRAAVCAGKPYFDEVMRRLRKKLLIRAHDPSTKGWLYDRHCLTLMTSSLYADMPVNDEYCEEPIRGRTIAVLDGDKVTVKKV